MNAVKLAAIALIVAGILGLAYGSFSYTQGDPRGQAGLARTVGEGQADSQRPRLGRRGGDSGRRPPAVFAQAELGPTSEPPDPSCSGLACASRCTRTARRHTRRGKADESAASALLGHLGSRDATVTAYGKGRIDCR